jgi:hypothetical protein
MHYIRWEVNRLVAIRVSVFDLGGFSHAASVWA